MPTCNCRGGAGCCMAPALMPWYGPPCTCPTIWHGIYPPPCPRHNPTGSNGRIFVTTIGTRA
jgi:hypothetical protein